MESSSSVRRAEAFTYSEKTLLLKLIQQRPVVNNKRSDATTNHKKANAWLAVCAEYNFNTSGPKRSVKQLQRCYDKMKRYQKYRHQMKIAIKSDEQMNTNNHELINTPTPVVINKENCIEETVNEALNEPVNNTRPIYIAWDQSKQLFGTTFNEDPLNSTSEVSTGENQHSAELHEIQKRIQNQLLEKAQAEADLAKVLLESTKRKEAELLQKLQYEKSILKLKYEHALKQAS